MKTDPRTPVNMFMNELLKDNELKNDAALAKKIGIQPPVISKVRCNLTPIGAHLMLRLHEKLGTNLAKMRRQIPAEFFYDAKKTKRGKGAKSAAAAEPAAG